MAKQLLSERQIRRLIAEASYPHGAICFNIKTDDTIRVTISHCGELIGQLEADKISKNIWEIVASCVENELNGEGKLLYYAIMGKVYPDYICADLIESSPKAQRIYKAFEQLDYVEKRTIDGVRVYRFK